MEERKTLFRGKEGELISAPTLRVSRETTRLSFSFSLSFHVIICKRHTHTHVKDKDAHSRQLEIVRVIETSDETRERNVVTSVPRQTMVDEKLAPSGRDGAKGAGRDRDRRARRTRYTHTHGARMWVLVVYRYAREERARVGRSERARRGEGWRPNEEERRVGKRKGSGAREGGRRGKSATLATTVTETADYYSSLFQRENMGEGERHEM